MSKLTIFTELLQPTSSNTRGRAHRVCRDFFIGLDGYQFDFKDGIVFSCKVTQELLDEYLDDLHNSLLAVAAPAVQIMTTKGMYIIGDHSGQITIIPIEPEPEVVPFPAEPNNE